MRLILSISYILLLTGFTFSQEYMPYNTFNKEAELQKFIDRGGKVEEIENNIYKLTYLTGETRTFYLNKSEVYDKPAGINETIINIWEIDTTEYNSMFKYWQTVQIANSHWQPMFIEDLNRNGRPELYGYGDFQTIGLLWGGPVKIFERSQSGIFQNVFTYDSSTISPEGIGDIHGTGSKEIYMRSRLADNGAVYRSDSLGGLPTNFDFIFYYEPNQINNMTFGDFDKNGITDCAFVEGASWQKFFIGEFRDSINNFKEVFSFSTTDQGDFAGFAIEDFDEDGKTEIIMSTGNRSIFIFENNDISEYSLINHLPFPIPNVYMQTVTNDIDGNGKKEFWIGGQNIPEGITLYQCYEADGDNSYIPVASIELRYSTSFVTNWIQAVDIDDDGKEELIISSGNIILILKFTGSPGDHQYKLYYAKLGEATQYGAEIHPAAIADLNGDGKKDILVPFRKSQWSTVLSFSYILVQDNPNNIDLLATSNLHTEDIAAYPNPFNSTSTIKFSIQETSKAQIKIYNSIGKEIKTLLDKELSPGQYDITWDAKNNNGEPLSSGLYIIVLQTNNSIKTNKVILLK
jgi:hypothetical protein